MGVARQASAPATSGFMFQLKAEGHDEGEDTFEQRLAIAKPLEVRRFTPEINGDGAVFAGLAGRVAHGHPSVIRSRKLRRHHGGNACKSQDYREELRGLPLKAMEGGFSWARPRCGCSQLRNSDQNPSLVFTIRRDEKSLSGTYDRLYRMVKKMVNG
jgi:hypothetical protein